MADEESSGPIPPYASFTTIQNLVQRMEKHGIPSRIDSSYLVGMAGGTQNQVKHALRSLDFVSDDNVPTQRMTDYVRRPDDRPALLATLLQERYPRLTQLGENATRGELDEALKAYGLGGATARKSASFYLTAATYAGLPLSPHVKPARSVGGSTGQASGTRKRKRKPAPETPPAPPAGQEPPPGYSTEVTIGRDTKLILTVQNPDPFGLSLEDRTFIFDLIDKMKERESKSGSENGTREEDSS